MKLRNIGLIFVAVFFVIGCSQFINEQSEPKSLALAYAGNLDGELEPCGCSLEGNLGGVLRQATTLDEWRASTQELFIISSGGLIASQTPHDKITAEYILKGYAQLGFDAIGVQWPDRAYGDVFVKQAELPWVASNASSAFAERKEVRKGGVTLAIYSWLDPDAMGAALAMMGESANGERLAAISEGLAQAKKEGKTTVLLSTLELAKAQQLFNLENIDILLIKSAYEVYGEPRKVGNTLVLQPGSRGMRFARLDAKLDERGSIASFEHVVKSMPPDVADSPRLASWYQAYNDKLKEDYQASVELKKQLAAQGSPYAGAKACESCHASAYATWKSTKHAKAYRALTKVNKAFDAACVKCHVVGFEKPGGFIDTELTKNLANVQCESCHGAAAEHVASAGAKPVANKGWEKAQVCAQCHVQKHSPSFKIEEYWPKIAH